MSDKTITANLRMLAILAHPDDEVFSCGGVMALNRRRGIHTTLVCATKGEAGEISHAELATPDNLGVVREQELMTAARYMGVDDLYFLGYRDSGMAGTPENQHPNAFANASASAVVHRLVRFIRTIQPQVVITFDPTGGYGHPDHVAIHKHTLAACRAAADAAYAPHLGEPWQTQRIFYPTFRREMFEAIRDQMLALGLEPPDFGIEEDDNQPEQPAHARIDVNGVAQDKWAAFRSHRTQFGSHHPFLQLPEPFVLDLLSHEWFELAWPEAKPDALYSDLFAGLDG